MFQPKIRVLGFGHPMVDISIEITSKTLLEKYDLPEDGAKELSPEQIFNLQQDVANERQTLSAGGGAQNTLRVLKWLLTNQIEAVMYGSAGDDAHRHVLEGLLRQDQVVTNYTIDKSLPTALTVALVRGVTRSLAAYIGAAKHPPDLPNLEKFVTSSAYVYLEGFFLTNHLSLAQKICVKFKGRGLILFNLASEYICKQFRPAVSCIVKHADVILGNRREFSEFQLDECKMQKTSRIEKKMFVITDGAQPVVCYAIGQRFSTEVVPILPEQIVDTIGAGDAFAAGFLAGMIEGADVLNCLKKGCYAAHCLIKETGCTIPLYPAKA